MKKAVIKTGGKQYIVSAGDTIVVDRLKVEDGKPIELDILALFDTEKNAIELGNPLLKSKAQATIVENIKGDKLRVARFKAKSRYRRVTGFRAYLSKITINAI
ncbi:50S ribosomal protein L21 [Candidatus Roizmanbacteria bacterium RIFCSPHIGHO2_02_FULL_40_13b]|uniref:Large ribosomal subunit protein bL21 n=1 Tax=Candidatus Roizmanbacteria bacterium RIFCSPHIGHO2_01_FULL_39_24 TaxID=1802032 RepID=A0A1F7GGH3_9BACT|nr:MAG: 50S ribosomal protein L21 [Candidatus Roizmanbacteria bacterium RIFCSPHIGHO2_01_FULL_39_24]OGK28049.1 MAG: 50S ribosomal protein L21 [Candidatus Roizmanbacteria bacterium RIFCSPHIGHO2_02_FULL_40_13b]OGK49558.1 MAG: 50S ribosomal protein L21 [Candidatus Roizmanbacteria bacterium RIFCSPLOWO2_01_FULL_40_32]OGK56419.1 MAG: 50S ribosomal protein L21 [Candidatus Roizmanbacteria bacterium RIFCSPLOWO2_02_FULL_39_8]